MYPDIVADYSVNKGVTSSNYTGLYGYICNDPCVAHALDLLRKLKTRVELSLLPTIDQHCLEHLPFQ